MSIVRVPAPLAEPVAESVPIPPQGSSTLGESTAPKEGLEGVDPAIADALKAPKNRQTGVGNWKHRNSLFNLRAVNYLLN